MTGKHISPSFLVSSLARREGDASQCKGTPPEHATTHFKVNKRPKRNEVREEVERGIAVEKRRNTVQSRGLASEEGVGSTTRTTLHQAPPLSPGHAIAADRTCHDGRPPWGILPCSARCGVHAGPARPRLALGCDGTTWSSWRHSFPAGAFPAPVCGYTGDF